MKKADYTYRTLKEEDISQIKQLIKETFPSFLSGDYWEWKYLKNPNFDPSLIFVVAKNGEIIGCTHVLPQKLKIAKDLAIDAYLGADLVIKREYRRKGIGKMLVNFSRIQVCRQDEKNPLVRAFTNIQLSKHFHEPILGYISVKSSTKTYVKLLTWKSVFAKIEKINQGLARKYPKTVSKREKPLKVLLKLQGTVPLTLSLRKDKIELDSVNDGKIDVVIEGSFSFMMSLSTVKHVKWKLFLALLTRKVKVHGKITKIFRLFKVLQLLEKILRYYKSR